MESFLEYFLLEFLKILRGLSICVLGFQVSILIQSCEIDPSVIYVGKRVIKQWLLVHFKGKRHLYLHVWMYEL